jgi:hypothetical protein
MQLVLSMLAAVLMTALSGCLFTCENEMIQNAPSPDGTLRAVAFCRSCGATTSDSVHVYLGAPADEVPDVGNVFRGTHSKDVKLRWDGNGKLIIESGATVFLLMKEYAGVTFEFREH